MTTDNRTNEPSEAQVEAAAKAIWATRYPESRPDIAEATWAEISGYGAWTPEALDIMTEARAALVAAAGAAPVQPSSTVDEGKIAAAKHKVDSIHQIHGIECLCGFSSARSRSRTEHITAAVVEAI